MGPLVVQEYWRGSRAAGYALTALLGRGWFLGCRGGGPGKVGVVTPRRGSQTLVLVGDLGHVGGAMTDEEMIGGSGSVATSAAGHTWIWTRGVCWGENLPGAALADGGDAYGRRYLLEDAVAAFPCFLMRLLVKTIDPRIGRRRNSGAVSFLKEPPWSP